MAAVLFLLVFPAVVAPLHASVFGELTAVVHDPQHHPLPGTDVQLQAAASALTLRAVADGAGVVHFYAVPLGDYTVAATHPGFAATRQQVTVLAGNAAVLHLQLEVAAAPGEVVNVEAQTGSLAGTASPVTLLSQRTIDVTPGADRTNSLAMITDYVPGAYLTHDMLHMRGGHQVSWLLDGVEIPNTNISSNLGPQVDPRDVAYLQINRGSYGAELGDRTYGVFDVNPKSGFERNRTGELRLTAGSALSTDDQLSFGDHNEHSAFYLSLNGNRSDYGLSAPVEHAFHDAENGFGGFGSLTSNHGAGTQLRLLAQLRADSYQIPYDPDPASYENQLYNSSGLRDVQHESDAVMAFTWTQSLTPRALLELSPFYHRNRASYEPGADDTPIATTADRTSQYAGLQAGAHGTLPHQQLEGGLYAWGQHDSNLLSLRTPADPDSDFRQSEPANGGLVEAYAADAVQVGRYLQLSIGLRQSWFSGTGVAESATSPRFGVALHLPHLSWTLRAFYGRFYQPPPLLTAAGPVIAYATANNTGFAPLHGERDEEHQFGLSVPLKGWVLDADTFETRATNFLDHANLGESSLYFPVTIAGALVQAWELTLRSPQRWRHGTMHLAYSNQLAQQRGALTGGLICTPAGAPDCAAASGYTPLDHDQRNTLSVGGDLHLPGSIAAAVNVAYGSGFVNGYPDPPSPYTGSYLPGHTTVDLRLSRSFGEAVSVAVDASNVANRRVLLDNSLTFGGFHFNDPRQIYAEVRYRFRY